MIIKFNANQLIDAIIAEFDMIEGNKRYVPKGLLLPDASYMASYKAVIQAEERITAIGQAFGISGHALYYIARAARRWYKRTDWQYCLNEGAAEGLLTYALNNFQTGHWDTCKPERVCEHQKYCHLY